ncbi:DUF4942 domain-containing protein [Algiphilus sp.]|uniref:DUF4942 domain-containing protein n=1 Tax=Algiphilus sp. TaxID=1872431 RepID=UPI003BAD382A
MSVHTDIALPQTLSDLIRTRDEVVTLITKAHETFDEAKARAESIGRYTLSMEVLPRVGLNQAIREIDRKSWRAAFDLAGFNQIWDAKAIADFEESIRLNPAPFTDAAVRGTFMDLLPRRDEFFARGLVRTFRMLSGNYKRHENAAFEVPRKLICGYWCRPSFSSDSHMLVNDSARGDEFRDFMRVVWTLTDRAFDPRAIVAEVQSQWQQFGEYRDQYIRLIPYRNQNVHIHILSEHLRDRINGVIAEFYGEQAVASKRKRAA